MNDKPEANLRPTLRAAAQGDFGALEALQRLARQDKRIFTRALPLAFHHLRLPSPPYIPAPSNAQEELLADQAINIIVTGAEDQRSDVLETFMLSEADNLLRWIMYLSTKWLFKLALQDMHTIPATYHPFREELFWTLPGVLKRMAEHPKTLAAMKGYPQVGTLLAQMTIVANRDKRPQLIGLIRGLQARMAGTELRINQPYMPAFLGFLEVHSKIFTETAISHIKDYSRDVSMAHKLEVPDILLHLCICIGQGDVVLDDCLAQGGFIRALMILLAAAIRDLEKFSGSWTDRKQSSLGMIIAITLILEKGFARAGAPLITAALHKGLLEAITCMLLIFNIPRMHHPQIQHIDQPLSKVVELILANVVYVSVLKPALEIRHMFDAVNASKNPPLKLNSSNKAMIRLCLRLREEFSILDKGGEGREYLKAYKFCDNVSCPHVGDTSIRRLGCCTACQSGYYCSRSCQKVVWKNGHRQECKKVIAGMKDGQEGFPPVLTIHDTEYFRRTLSDRLRYYREDSQIPDSVGENAVVYMDLTTFPATISTCDAGDPNPGSDGHSLPLAKAKFPTCSRLGDGVVIALHSDTIIEY